MVFSVLLTCQMRHICSSINKTLSTCVEPVLKLEMLNDEQEKKFVIFS